MNDRSPTSAHRHVREPLLRRACGSPTECERDLDLLLPGTTARVTRSHTLSIYATRVARAQPNVPLHQLHQTIHLHAIQAQSPSNSCAYELSYPRVSVPLARDPRRSQRGVLTLTDHPPSWSRV
eukprot:1822670-Pyramimonas_sp.AAC.2